MRLLGIGCPDSYRALRPERNGAGEPSTLTAHGAQAAVAPVRRARRARDDRPLRARGRPRGRLRRAVALVGRRPRGLLGRDLGVLRRAGLRAVRARARARARCPARSGSRGRGCPTPSTSSAAATTTRWPSATPASCASCRSGRGASCASRPRASPPGCGAWASARATASPPTCRTSPRRSRPSWPPPRSARCGRAPRPEFGARSVIDRFAQIEPKVLLAVDGYRYGGRDHDRGEVVAGIAEEIGAQVVRFGYLDGSGWPAELVGRRRAADLRAGAVRPPAVAALQLGHDRACPSRSSTARAGSCSSTSSTCTCTSTRRRATASSGSPRPAG